MHLLLFQDNTDCQLRVIMLASCTYINHYTQLQSYKLGAIYVVTEVSNHTSLELVDFTGLLLISGNPFLNPLNAKLYSLKVLLD